MPGDVDTGDIAILQDRIAQLEQMLAALRDADLRNKAMLEAMPDQMFVLTRDGTCLDYKPDAEDPSGVPASQVIGRNIRDIGLSPTGLSEALFHIERVLTLQRVEHYDYVLQTPDGAQYFNSRLAPLGQDRVITIVRNLTQRTRIEDQLRRSETRLRRYFDLSVTGMAITSPNQQWIDANEALCRMLGRSLEELRQTTWAALTHPDDLQSDEAQFNRLLSGEIERYALEKRFLRPDGSIVETRISVGCERGADGAVEHVVCFLEDITERSRIERELFQAQKMEAIGQLAGGVAHDFNNMLTGILGNAEMLSSQLVDRPDLQELATRIALSCDHSATLVQQLLSFARKGQTIKTDVNLHDVISDVANILKSTLDRRIAIRLDLHATHCLVSGDTTRLENALLNLGLNARDALPNGGEIRFETSNVAGSDTSSGMDGEAIQIRVADNGEGMNAETRRHLFEPFFTTKAPGKGTGLGLASVYGTIKSHSGTIRIDSALGRGTTVDIRLPVVPGAAGPPRPLPDLSKQPRQAARILLVDDEDAVRDVAQRILEHLGHQVVAARNGVEAVRYYKDHYDDIDMVILDMVMPRMSGKETFIALRQIHPGVRVLLSSGFSAEGEAQEILELGVRAFIQKPFRIADIAQRVSEVLNGR